MDRACLRGIRQSYPAGEPGWGMSAKAGHEERMLLDRLNRKVTNLPNMAGAFDESREPAERNSSPITTVRNYRCKGAAMWGLWTEGTSIRVGRMFLDDLLMSMQSDDISLSMAFGAEGAGEGNRHSTQDPAATPEP